MALRPGFTTGLPLSSPRGKRAEDLTSSEKFQLTYQISRSTFRVVKLPHVDFFEKADNILWANYVSEVILEK